MARVNIQNVHKSFGETEVLKDISVAIEDGEFLVLGNVQKSISRC